VAVGDGVDVAGLALVPGRGVALEIGRIPAISGVSIIPTVFLSGRVLRFLVGVQRSDVTPPMRILERPEAAYGFYHEDNFASSQIVRRDR